LAFVQLRIAGKYWLGLGLKKVEGDLATYLGSDKGMFIFEVYPNSPASKAEWKVGDILLSFNDKEVSDFESLLSEISAVETKSVQCELLRKGEKVEANISAEARPTDVPQIEADAKGLSWTFEALPENTTADAEGVKTMILRRSRKRRKDA
jgi:C-terminal processing protease CtpA/Prc